MEYIYKQLELDFIFITEPNEAGEQQITDTGKNQQYKEKIEKERFNRNVIHSKKNQKLDYNLTSIYA